jgi:hypothetical protein
MRKSPTARLNVAFIVTAASLTMAACGGGRDNSTNLPASNANVAPSVSTTPDATVPVTNAPVGDTLTAGHHSKLAGAAVGAVAGHMLGGHAVAGAAVGALVQHERNKHHK